MKLPHLVLALLVMGMLLASCGEPSPDTPGPGTTTPAGSTEPTPDATDAPTTAPPPTEPAASPSPAPIAADPPPLALEMVTGGLSAPTNITTTPDGRLLVNERPGRVIAVDPASGDTSVALDLTDRVLGQGEQGLLGLALHPDWPTTDRAFLHYSDRNGDTVISEFRASAASPPTLDRSSEHILLQVDQPYSNHNGGQLAFGPDGHLWIGLGDGGAGGDPENNGQDPGSLLGSLLRLDVSQPGEYAVPPDNPFADGGGAGEVYLYGLRNPWRFSFDHRTGQLWVADVGQNAYEEVNRLDPSSDAGANLGWNRMEASHCFAEEDCSSEGLVLPVTEYGRDLGCSITGGYVYRGAAIPDLRGWYLFGDYCSGIIFGIPSDATELTEPRQLADTGASIASFGEGPDGELFMADLASGSIYRIVAGD